LLAGGLTPDNVGQAVSTTRAPMVDVSSGVEAAPGEKDADLMRAFVDAAKQGHQA
ncbi:MAG: N-(5'-phosphoribosyl)anthranilate isomerase, partial [Pseudomonadota bacterium]|nr:N-(5'-phosphoribosyl)anthranilate isomerase [Pseudomonadota bacterium]